ncbi:hypothetical protein C8J57DRAFT_1721375 [Mycena rebaudengoi]|nr:hypothetical protein C8J57DRAFT_1721375 [Mycena rebaudengoi]
MDLVSAAPPGSQIVELAGPLVLAYLLHWGLFGTLSVQIYLYYQAFPNDIRIKKSLVYTVYTIELTQTILVTHEAFTTFGYHFGNAAAITKVRLTQVAVAFLAGLVALIIQSFYAYRLYMFFKAWFLPGVIVVISLISAIGAFLIGVTTIEVGDLALLNTRADSAAAVLWWGGSALSDVMIAICMTYYLSMHDTAFRKTRALLSKLIRLTIETGSLTAFVGIMGLVLCLAFPGIYFTVPALVLPKLYANSMMVVFNTRFQILGGWDRYICHGLHLSSEFSAK